MKTILVFGPVSQTRETVTICFSSPGGRRSRGGGHHLATASRLRRPHLASPVKGRGVRRYPFLRYWRERIPASLRTGYYLVRRLGKRVIAFAPASLHNRVSRLRRLTPTECSVHMAQGGQRRSPPHVIARSAVSRSSPQRVARQSRLRRPMETLSGAKGTKQSGGLIY